MTSPRIAAMRRFIEQEQSGWPLSGVLAWLVTEGREIEDTGRFVGAFCDHLAEAGAALLRVRVTMMTLHPEVRDFSYTWSRGGAVSTGRIPHGIENSPSYLGSPWDHVFSTGTVYRRRLDGLDEGRDHALLHEVKALGGTDYCALPLRSGGQVIGAIGIVVDGPAGFGDDNLLKLELLADIVTPILHVTALEIVARSLLDTYVGHRTGARVLSGQIRRGDADTIEAAISICDLRDFTVLSETLPPDALLALLNAYFEVVGAAVTARGGEILKFMGDAVLTIFPTSAEVSLDAACDAALDAAIDLIDSLDAVNHRRRRAGEPPIRFGVGLHQGAVIYGNVGAAARLDFTVIGAAVNRTARLEKLTNSLDHRLLMSAEFAARVSTPVRSLGRHALAGVAEPQEVFTRAE